MLVLASKYRNYYVNGCHGGFVKTVYCKWFVDCRSEVSAALTFT